MKYTRHLLLAAAIGVTTALPLTGLAQGSATTAAAAAPSAAGEMTDAEVRKVDRNAGKVTLKHGAIKNLDMPPMTMVFVVTDTALLDKVKEGDRIRFTAITEGGKFTLTDLQPAD